MQSTPAGKKQTAANGVKMISCRDAGLDRRRAAFSGYALGKPV